MSARYLRPNVTVEPLVASWYATPNLVPPVGLAMTLANKFLPILKSFVSYPSLHVDALKNPAMAGGPFLALPPERAPQVQALVEQTERDHRDLLGLVESLRELDKLLAAQGTGESLERLYPLVPERLRGYVELRYDLHHRASARLLESLLYKSPYYKESAQAVGLARIDGDERAFAFSTPRLAGDDRFVMQVPFRDPALSRLLSAKRSPAEPEALAEDLRLPASERERFLSFFTDEAPAVRAPFEEEGVRVRYFGHACILIEARGASVLLDPAVSLPYQAKTARFTTADLPPHIDFALITHAHVDHFSFETLLQLRDRIGTVVVPRSNGGGLADPSLGLMLRTLGFPNVRELDELESIPLEGGEIVGLPFFGEHADLDIRSKLAYLVRLQGKTVIAAADSNALEPRLYQHVSDVIGPLDALFLGMECEGAPLSWWYGPYFSAPPPRKLDQTRRLNGANFQRAQPMVEFLRPRRLYNYAMGLEPWFGHIMGLNLREDSPQMIESNKMLEYCRSQGIEAARPFAQLEVRL